MYRLAFIVNSSLVLGMLVLFPMSTVFSQDSGGITDQYRRALEINPDDLDSRYLLGVSLLREKSFSEAVLHLEKVYQSRATDMDMNYNLGLAHSGAGNLESAIKYFRILDNINAVEARDKYNIDTAFYNIGISYAKLGKLDDALMAHNEAVRLNPDSKYAYCGKGEVLYQKKDLKGAMEALSKCSERNPEKIEIRQYISSMHLTKGIEHVNRKELVDARLELEKATAGGNIDSIAFYYLAYVDYLEGDFKKALSSLFKLKDYEKDDIKKARLSLLQNIGAQMQRMGDWKGAASAYEEALKDAGRDADIHFNLGYCYMKSGEPEAALASFRKAIEIDPAHQRAAINIGIVSEMALKGHLKRGERYLEEKKYSEAASEYKTALSIDPKNPTAIDGKEKAEKEVERLSKEAAEQRARDISAKLAEAEKHLDEGRYLGAIEAFSAVTVLDPQNQKGMEGLDRARGRLKELRDASIKAGEKAVTEEDYNLAAAQYSKYLELDPSDGEVRGYHERIIKLLSAKVAPILAEAQELEKVQKFADSIKAYERVLVLHPTNEAASNGKKRVSDEWGSKFNDKLALGKRYAAEGELMKAAEALSSALELKPDNIIALEEFKAVADKLKKVLDVRLSDAAGAVKSGRYGDAISNYRAILAIDKENREAQAGLQNAVKQRDDAVSKRMSTGLKAYKEGNLSLAIASFNEVLQIDGANQEAAALLKDARSKQDESITPWLKAGIDAYKKGDIDGAVVSFRKVLNLDPANKEAKEYLGRMDVQKAKMSVEKEVEKYYLKGIELYTDGKYREAMESWKKVLELDPKHEKALLNIEKAKRKMEGVMDVK